VAVLFETLSEASKRAEARITSATTRILLPIQNPKSKAPSGPPAFLLAGKRLTGAPISPDDRCGRVKRGAGSVTPPGEGAMESRKGVRHYS